MFWVHTVHIDLSKHVSSHQNNLKLRRFERDSQHMLLWLNNPLYNEQILPHYILKESNFNIRYVRLCDLHIRTEIRLKYLQTVETLIRYRDVRRLIWVCTVCQLQWDKNANEPRRLDMCAKWRFKSACASGMRSLISVVVVRMKKFYMLGYPKCA